MEMDKEHIRMIEDIHDALVGNKYNEKGLIKRVEIVETKSSRHEIVLKIISGVILFLVAAVAFLKDIIDIFR